MTSSAGELVFANSLIMAEIYGYLEAKTDLANCLLISKAGYNTAAKRLYREMRSVDVSYIFESLCSMVNYSIEQRLTVLRSRPDKIVFHLSGTVTIRPTKRSVPHNSVLRSGARFSRTDEARQTMPLESLPEPRVARD